MSWIALAIALSAALAFASTPEGRLEPAPVPRPVAGADWCAAARAVAEMPPCLDPASCQAVGAWEELVAPPGARLAPGVPPGPGSPPASAPPGLRPRPRAWRVSTCLAGPR